MPIYYLLQRYTGIGLLCLQQYILYYKALYMENTPGFTPVRRRKKPQYNESPALSVHAPWTTARCNRLLRPIASRIALLRKNRYPNIINDVPIIRGTQSRQGEDVIDNRRRLDTILANKKEVGQRIGAASYRHDPDWVPSPVLQRKIKHTYSGRCIGKTAKQNGVKRQCIDEALAGDGALRVSTYDEYEYTQSSSGFQQDADEGQQSGGTASREEEESSIKGQRKPCRQSRNRDLVPDTRESFSKLAKSVSPSHWMLINGLYDGLHALLKATSRSTSSSTRGPRSLLATCLRKVPEYIAAEQEWHDQENLDDDLDMSSVVYSDLESFGSSGAPGWKPLREVVRSHGVTLLGEAIRDGLVKQDIARGLILLCLQSSAFDEAQHLVESVIAIAGQLQKPSTGSMKLFEAESSACLSTLDLFARRTGRSHVQFRHLATLLNSGCLPIEWIATSDFVTCWKRVIFSISREDDHAGDASHLLQTAVSLSYGGMKATASPQIHNLRLNLLTDGNTLDFESIETLNNSRPTVGSKSGHSFDYDSAPSRWQKSLDATISGLLIFLCSYILQPSPAMDSVVKELCNSSSTALRHLAIDAQQACELIQPEKTSSRFIFSAERAILLLLADALIVLPPKSSDTDIVRAKLAKFDIVAPAKAKSAVEDIYTPFLCAVVQCCERSSPGGAFERLRGLVHELVEVSTSGDIEPAPRTLCGLIAVNTALEFSEGTGQAKHLEWALDVEDGVDGYHSKMTSRTPAKTPARAANKSGDGYRWEEGLCEWIAKTPALLVRKAGIVDEVAEDSSSASDPSPAAPDRLSEISAYEPHARKTRWTSGEAGHGYGHCRQDRAQKRAPCGADRPLSKPALQGLGCVKARNSGALMLRKRVFEVDMDDDDEDELSTPESSQEHPNIGRRSLYEITNEGVAKVRKGAASRPRNGSGDVPKHSTRRARWAGMKHEDESEDELGI